MGMAVVASAASLAVGYYNSFNNNKLSHQAKDIADQLKDVTLAETNTVNITTLIDEATALNKELYKASRVQGITLDVVLCLIALPSFLESCGHHAAKNTLTWGQYLSQNWDYLVGRALQAGGFGLMGKGIHEDGAGNPQFATTYVGFAPLTICAGTLFVERNRARQAQLAEALLPVQQNQQGQGLLAESLLPASQHLVTHPSLAPSTHAFAPGGGEQPYNPATAYNR